MKNGNVRLHGTKNKPTSTLSDPTPSPRSPRVKRPSADSAKLQTALYRIADAASAIIDLPEFYAELHRIVGELMYAPTFYLLLIDHVRQLGYPAYWADEAGDPSPPTVSLADLLMSRRLVNVVLDSGKALHVSREQIEEMKRQSKVDPYGTPAEDWIGAPLVSDGRVDGVLVVQSYKKGMRYSEQDAELLTFVAQHIAVALTRARAIEETRQRAAELAVINSVQQGLGSKLDMQGIYDLVGNKIREIFDAQAVALLELQPDTETDHYRYVIEKGKRVYPDPYPYDDITRHLVTTRQSLLINEDADRRFEQFGIDVLPGTEPVKSALFVPLVVDSKVKGIVTLQNVDRENAFSESDVRLLETLASSMSVALENARLFEAERQRAAELAVINSVQQALASKLDFQGIVDLVGDKLGEVFSADVTNIRLYDREKNLIEYAYMVDHGERYEYAPEPPMGFSLHIIQTRQPIIIHNHEEEERLRAKLGSKTLGGETQNNSFVYLPILRSDQVMGIVVIGKLAPNAFSDSDLNLLTTLSNSMSVALENARLFDETQRLFRAEQQRAAELAIVNSVQQGLASKLDIQAIFDLVGDKIRELFDAQVVAISTYDREANIIQFRYNIEKGERQYIDPIPLTEGGFSPHVIRTGQPVVINENLRQRAAEFASFQIAGEATKSGVWLPLVVGGAVKGVISLQNVDRENAFSESDVRLLQTLASSMGVALENARLFDEGQRLLKETEQRATELEIINGIQAGLVSKLNVNAIYELVGERLRHVFAKFDLILGLYDPGADIIASPYAVEHGRRLSLRPFRVAGIGFLGEVIRTRRAVLINENVTEAVKRAGSYIVDGTAPPKSALYVPLVVGDTVRGLVVLQDMEREHAFSDSDVRLLETIANSMSVALENARLFDETQRLLKETEQRNAELMTVNRVSQALASQVELAALIQLAGDQIRDSFHADIAYIALLDRESNSIRFPYTYGEDLTPMKLGEGMASKIIQTGQPLLINRDMETRRAELGATRVGLAAKSYIGVPIMIGEDTIGVISVQSTHEEGRFDENDERLLATIAANVGAAIEKARLFDETVKQREYLEAVLQTSPVAITLVDPEQTVVSWNPAAEKLFGYTQEEAIGHNVDDLVANIPEIRADADRFTPKSYQGYTHHAITKRTRKDHTLVDVELFGELVQLGGKVAGGFAIYHDITEIQRARQAAEDANRAKSTFLANMSHELRTPLNAIIGFTRIVRRKSEGVLADRQIENLDKVLVSADHLLSLINTVLDIAKIEAGRMDVAAAHFDVRALIDLCGTTAQPLLKPGVMLEKEIPRELPLVYSDQDKVKQIILNLLSNAAKFTPAGTITIRASTPGNTLAIAVRDTGIGIAPDALDKIFDEFQQADATTTRQYGGTGLGLSISRSLARLLGGDLTATSTPGAGSTFTLTIPLHYGKTPAQVPAPSATGLGQEPQPSGEPIVLAIDDDPDVLFLLRENLGEAGYAVIGATSGDAGIQTARNVQPFAITLDIMMPHKDGWQILHELKSDPLTHDIPVLMLTIVDKRQLGYQLGAADYLVKPFDADQVLRALRRLTRINDGVAPHRLLVADDDPNVVEMVKQLLDGAGYQIDAAPDGQAALDRMASHQPDAVLLDLIMPRVDGFGVIERMRVQPELARIPVIVLTAKELSSDESARLNESIDHVLHKDGLEGKVLIDNLQRVLEKYRA